MRRIGRTIMRNILPAVLLLALIVLVVFPLAMLVYASFLDSPPRPGAPEGHFTLSNYATFGDPLTLEAAGNSIAFALGATTLALVIGSLLAWLVARTDVPAKPMVTEMITPIFISPSRSAPGKRYRGVKT